MVSGTRMLAMAPLGAVGCGVGNLWIGFVCPVHLMVAQSDWDLGNLRLGGVNSGCS